VASRCRACGRFIKATERLCGPCHVVEATPPELYEAESLGSATIPDTPMDFTIVAKDPGSSAVLDRMRVRRRWPWRKRR
jgi:hypothetical protein